MAKVKFGGGVAEIRGTVNGAIFSRNPSGAYIRNYVTPVQPESIAQIANRTRFKQTSAEWASITQTEQEAWRGVSYMTADNIGNQIRISGYQAFMQLNKMRSLIGESILTLPPTDTQPENPFSGITLNMADELIGPPARKMIKLEFAPTPLLAGHVLIVSASAKQPIGRNTAKGLERTIAISIPLEVSPWDITDAYEDYHGQMSGDDTGKTKIFVLIKIVKISSGVSRIIARGGGIYGQQIDLIG